MKTFLEFQEQVNQIIHRKEKKELDKKENIRYITKQIGASSKHRSHVHREIAQQARLAQQQSPYSGVG